MTYLRILKSCISKIVANTGKEKQLYYNEPQISPKKAWTPGILHSKKKFGPFHQHQVDESQYISFIYKYHFVDIQ